MLRELQNGALDIVGDIHGEIDAVRNLLKVLGYDAHGKHPGGRSLVFVGDLVDRGPDSPAVVRLVRQLVDAGRAQAILGNHELNILRGERKQGNDWFWSEGSPRDLKFSPFENASITERDDMLRFFESLPIALSRDDLRICHAAWHEPSLTALSGGTGGGSIAELFDVMEERAEKILRNDGWHERAEEEKSAWAHLFATADVDMPMLHALGKCDEIRQMDNPLRVLTSGIERKAELPFFTSGQWRFSERQCWWDEYRDDVPVVVGHFWRQYLPMGRAELGKGDPYLFEGVAPNAWLGTGGRVFCVDYSVGGRYAERNAGNAGARTRLAALRWPERELMFECGERVATQGF